MRQLVTVWRRFQDQRRIIVILNKPENKSRLRIKFPLSKMHMKISSFSLGGSMLIMPSAMH